LWELRYPSEILISGHCGEQNDFTNIPKLDFYLLFAFCFEILAAASLTSTPSGGTYEKVSSGSFGLTLTQPSGFIDIDIRIDFNVINVLNCKNTFRIAEQIHRVSSKADA
jgi:hypothetical protein